jgi:hypothetical protein
MEAARTIRGPCWYPTTILHSATTQKTMNSIFTVMKTSNPICQVSLQGQNNIINFDPKQVPQEYKARVLTTPITFHK